MPEALEARFLLDRQWHWLRGEMERSKEADLAMLARILSERGVPYGLADAQSLLEQDPSLCGSFSPDERALLDTVPR